MPLGADRAKQVFLAGRLKYSREHVLHDTALAAALADRLLHHGEVYHLKGDSYRLRGKPPGAESEPREMPSAGE